MKVPLESFGMEFIPLEDLENKFAQIDGNRDGKISMEEIATFFRNSYYDFFKCQNHGFVDAFGLAI